MMRTFVLLSSILGLGIACGCGANASSPVSTTESTVRGTAALFTFPVRPSKVTATDESGIVVTATIGADAHFALGLSEGHTYRLATAAGARPVPLVFPRASGKLATTFSVRSGGATIALGNVHYLPHAPAGGFKVSPAAATPSPTDAGSEDTPCTFCANDAPDVTCQTDPSAFIENESEGDAASSDPADGVGEADPKYEMAVADHNPPDDATGCSDPADGTAPNDPSAHAREGDQGPSGRDAE